MGVIAAEHLLQRIARPNSDSFPRLITVEPELIVRKSTGTLRVQEIGRRKAK